jgi:hypothetical protein
LATKYTINGHEIYQHCPIQDFWFEKIPYGNTDCNYFWISLGVVSSLDIAVHTDLHCNAFCGQLDMHRHFVYVSEKKTAVNAEITKNVFLQH